MLPYHGKLGLYVFLLSVLGATTIISTQAADAWNVWTSLVGYYVFVNIVVFAVFSEYAYQIAVRAAFLAWAFAVGLCIMGIGGRSWAVFGLYVCFMAFFHWSEFVTIAATNPKTLSVDSFILNHSAAYGIAAVASWLEFVIEWYFFPTVKYDYLLLVSVAGAVLCVGGELLRKTAMFTARTSFTHVVQSVREDDHQLVTTGVYALCRHPSYVGWFYWSLGTQVRTLPKAPRMVAAVRLLGKHSLRVEKCATEGRDAGVGQSCAGRKACQDFQRLRTAQLRLQCGARRQLTEAGASPSTAAAMPCLTASSLLRLISGNLHTV